MGRGGDYIVFYYLGASEIWPDKRSGLITGDLLNLIKFNINKNITIATISESTFNFAKIDLN